jgi:hypothetical protein
VIRGPRSPILPCLWLILSACEAGPSAFDKREAEAGPEDTADVSTLPEVPHAPDVEPQFPEVLAARGPQDTARGGEAGIPLDDSVGGRSVPEPGAVKDPGAPPSAGHAPAGEARFPRPEHVRGLYVNAWAAGSTRRMDAILDVIRRTEVNSLVIDMKDASGYVSHATRVPLARAIGATEEIRIRDLPGLLERLEDEGVYPIARIVVVKDPVLAEARPELAVQDTAGGVFVDSKGLKWLNPYSRAVWDYHVDIAREVAEMGFPEIQWDYVRFPDLPDSDKVRAVYPGAGPTSRPDAIRGFLAYARQSLSELDVVVTADVFGVTTSASRDVGIGQVWESFIGAVDVALPMVYPSHYWTGSFGFDRPNAHPYEVVRNALDDAIRRSSSVDSAGATRPWLQDFTLGEPVYGVPEVRAQIQATYDAGIQEWILWNPGSRFTIGALEPVDGFPFEPIMRVADLVIPVSLRWTLLDSATVEPLMGPDSVGAAGPDSLITAPDSAGRSPARDSRR